MEILKYIFLLIPIGAMAVPAIYGLMLLGLIIKKAGDRVMNMLTPLPAASVPSMPTIKIKRRMIDLETKQAVEESIEATPEQVRSIFRRS